MVMMGALDGLEELGFTEVPDSLASPLSGLLSSPDTDVSSDDGGRRRGATPPAGWGAAGGPSPPAAEGCSVYVSNLAYAVSRAALVRLFSGCGDVRRVSIPLDSAGRPQGHAYVEFGSAQEAQAALGVAGAQIGGRALRVSLKRSGSKQGDRPAAAPAPAGPPQQPHHHRASEPGGGRHAAAGSQHGGRQPRSGGGSRGRAAAGGGAQQVPYGGRGRVASDDASFYGVGARGGHPYKSASAAAGGYAAGPHAQLYPHSAAAGYGGHDALAHQQHMAQQHYYGGGGYDGGYADHDHRHGGYGRQHMHAGMY